VSKGLNKEKFAKVIPPLISSFTENGEIYEKGQREIISFLMDKGIRGFYVCGTYGLGPAMTLKQRKRIAEIVVDEAGSKATIIVHVGASNIDDVLELARHAEDIGADAVASVPPFYYRYDDEAMLRFYKALVSKVNIPVFVYNNPSTTHNPISSELLVRLANEGVAGIKDSSFSIVKFYEDIIALSGREFIFIIGTEALALPALMAGATGVISGLANAIPEPNIELFNLIKEGRYNEAIKKQLEVIKLRKLVHEVPTYPAIYEILKMRGVDAGYPKPPFRRLTEKEISYLKNKLGEYGYL